MSILDEFSARYSGRFFGKYRGFVTRVDDDPKQMGRIMVKVPVVLGTDDELGWALPSPAIGGSRNVGFVALPAKGDFVWVEFEEGDPERPIWSAGPWPLAHGESFMPEHAKGKPDATDYAMRDFGNIPPSQFAGSYGKVFTLQAHDGSFFELDGSDAHRVQMSHYTGTRIEMTQDGSLQEAVVGMARKRTTSDLNVEVGGSHLFYVCGEETKFVNGMALQTYAKGVSQLFGFRLNQLPGLDEASMTPTQREKLYIRGEAIYMPANLKQKGGAYEGIWDHSYVVNAGGQFKASSGGNLTLSCGGQFSAKSAYSADITATEVLELTGMAATSGDVSAATSASRPVTIYGYNGISEFVSYDVTGVASCAGLIAAPSSITRGRPVPSLTMFAAPGPKNLAETGIGGCIKLLGQPLANILLGPESTATQGVVVAELLETFLDVLLKAVGAHTHAVSGAVAATSADWPAAQALLISTLAAAVSSTKVKIAL